ncbi:hypothetical protein BO70DRAFT_420007 [Aspergillus heteromorphus CBS 117.55]|uniref:Protein kinase domain-containing protein n=1 Tax=Aspergillus heteromorphus CBS 117.55 TaxID=1448321 RepID=A0A317WSI3_9EURO|nr:uncharacterized protein BO70DRAFT_420007 [Aspergillus heteromorphus CBS 117.55]PWY88292.1 hypothetical protein BO70DRAFT_420007 [Aspergillus heteromorphus CBS 117.55]
MGDNHYETFQYGVGDTISIQSHNPPSPLSKKEIARRAASATWDQSLSPTELSLQNPPLPGSNGDGYAVIKLIDPVRVGYGKRSQIFVIKALNTSNLPHVPTDQDLVAKIYDPLSCEFDFDDEDPFLGVDYDYTHECGAYMHLSDLQGAVIPKFFGSFTLKIAVGDRFRLIRLILIEKINGISMDRLNPESFTTEQRQTILKEIVDAESLLYERDVWHEDLYPRNVIIECSGKAVVRVTVVDLGKSVIGRSRNPLDRDEEQRYLPGVFISPLLRWNVYFRRQMFFEDWINWAWQEWLEDEYKRTESTITEEQRELWRVYDWMKECPPHPSD